MGEIRETQKSMGHPVCFISRALVVLLTLSLLAAHAQSPITFQYIYDDLNQLAKVIDSTGVVIEYVYDPVGNIVQINRSTVQPGALTIFTITPTLAPAGTIVTIQGQGFSTTPASNRVLVNGVAATVISATATTLVIQLAPNATSGPISITVGSTTVTYPTSLTVLPTPVITSVTPNVTLSGTTIASFQITGLNLNASSFQFGGPITITSTSIDPSGTSAVLSLTIPAGALGRIPVIATNSVGSSMGAPVLGVNTLTVPGTAGTDPDGDGLSNAQELLLGTDPLNPDTDGDGFSDGAEVATGSDPLNPACTPLNCRVPGGEANSVIFSTLNTIPQTGSFRESDSITFSVINTIAPAGVFKESDSVIFSVLNTPSAPGSNEADSITFSVCNSVSALCPGFTHSFAPLEVSAVTSPPLSNTPDSKPGAPRRAVPTLMALTPLPNATGVRSDSLVTLIFSEAMDPDSLDSDSLQLFAGGKRVDAGVSISSDFRAVSLRPTSLPMDTIISLVVTKPLVSLTGQAVASFQSSFRTGDGHEGPAIEQHPLSGSSDIPSDASILLQSPKAAEVRLTQNGVAVPGTVQIDGDTMRFTPDLPLQSGAVVAVSLGAPDQYEGAFVVTGSVADVPLPVRVSPGLRGLAGPWPVIEIEYNKPLDPSTVNSDTISLRREADDVPAVVALSLRGDHTIRIVPLEPLLLGTPYYYEISTGVRDLAGGSMTTALRKSIVSQQSYSDQFSVAAIEPSSATTAVTVGSPVTIRFSHAVNPLSVTRDTIRVTSEAMGPIPMSVSFSDHFHQVVLTPLTALPDRAMITITISGIEDGTGNIIASKATTFSTAPSRPKRIAGLNIRNLWQLARSANRRR